MRSVPVHPGRLDLRDFSRQLSRDTHVEAYGSRLHCWKRGGLRIDSVHQLSKLQHDKSQTAHLSVEQVMVEADRGSESRWPFVRSQQYVVIAPHVSRPFDWQRR